MILCFGCKREWSSSSQYCRFRDREMLFLVLPQPERWNQSLLWKKNVSKKPWFSETCLGVTVLHTCAAADLCYQPSGDISFVLYPQCLLNLTGCEVTSRHKMSVLHGVHSIEYQGLDGPYRSLEKNGLLFSPHFRLGVVLNGSFCITYLYER